MPTKVTEKEISEFIENNQIELFPSQSALCIPIINRIYQKMINNIKFDDIKVCDDLVIDGHHRYFSSLLAGQPISTIKTLRSSATVKCDWRTINFVDTEWDTDAKIQKLNEDDALFNNIPLEKLVEMTR